MNGRIRSYYEDLKELMERISVCDARGRVVSFERGMECAIGLILRCAAKGGRLCFVGNGAGASIASHQAVDFWKGTGIPAFSFNDAALLTCISNDFGYPKVFEKPVELFLKKGDVLLALSCSGESENIVRASRAALKKGAQVITLTGFERRNRLSRLGNFNFHIPSFRYGPVEVVQHSLCHCMLDTIMKSRAKKARLR